MSKNYKQILSRDGIYPPFEVFSPVIKEEIHGLWKSYNESNKYNKLGLYIHIPFCVNICTFCHCNTFTYSKYKLNIYFTYLINEIETYSKIITKKSFDTIYLGGGTPSIFSEEQLDILFQTIFTSFQFKKDFHFCIEVMPETLTERKIDIFKKHGVTRITFGIQSLSTDVLKGINRKQDIEYFKKMFFYSKKMIKFTNVDVVAGLPLETLESFKKGIKTIISWEPDMIHIYRFVNDSNTIFTKQGKIYTKDMEVIKEKMYQFGIESIRNNGYNKIKNDDYAKSEGAKNYSITDRIEHASSNLGIGYSARSNIFGKISYDIISDDLQNFNYNGFGYGIEIEKNRYILQNMGNGLNLLKYKELFGSDFMQDFKKSIFLITKHFGNKVFIYKNKEILLNYEIIKNHEFALFFYGDELLYKLKNI